MVKVKLYQYEGSPEAISISQKTCKVRQSLNTGVCEYISADVKFIMKQDNDRITELKQT